MTVPDNTARNARILDLSRAGLGPTQIARQTHLTVNVVKSVVCRARQCGAIPPVRQLSDISARLVGVDTAQLTLRQIMVLLERSASATRSALRERGLPYRRAPSNWAAHTLPIGGDPRAKRREAMKTCPPRPFLSAVPDDPNPMGCRYIFGQAGEPEHRYCGERRRGAGWSYCAAHHELCHVRVERAA